MAREIFPLDFLPYHSRRGLADYKNLYRQSLIHYLRTWTQRRAGAHTFTFVSLAHSQGLYAPALAYTAYTDLFFSAQMTLHSSGSSAPFQGRHVILHGQDLDGRGIGSPWWGRYWACALRAR